MLFIDPKITDAYLRKAAVYEAMGERAKIKEMYKEALDTNPKLPQVNMALGRLYDLAGDKALAREHYFKEVRLNKGNKQAYVALGSFLYNNREWDYAGRVYRRLTELDPSEANYFVVAAQAFRMAGKRPEADKLIKRGLELFPANKHLLSMRGQF